jgi:hypothetical protein
MCGRGQTWSEKIALGRHTHAHAAGEGGHGMGTKNASSDLGLCMTMVDASLSHPTREAWPILFTLCRNAGQRPDELSWSVRCKQTFLAECKGVPTVWTKAREPGRTEQNVVMMQANVAPGTNKCDLREMPATALCPYCCRTMQVVYIRGLWVWSRLRRRQRTASSKNSKNNGWCCLSRV